MRRRVVVSPTSIRSRILKEEAVLGSLLIDPECFTHVDPFEDTERWPSEPLQQFLAIVVSPTSIRSRILKGVIAGAQGSRRLVSPTSIRSRILKAMPG